MYKGKKNLKKKGGGGGVCAEKNHHDIVGLQPKTVIPGIFNNHRSIDN